MADVNAFIVAALRSPIGRERGHLSGFEAHQLAGPVLRALVLREGRPHTGGARVILANTCNGGNVARLAALEAGLETSSGALTINAQCAGGLAAVRLGAEAILAGAASQVLAGGVDSVSRTIVSLGPAGLRRDRELPRISQSAGGLADPDLGAAADALGKARRIGRREQDAWAARSYERTSAARERGLFQPSVVALIAGGESIGGDELPHRFPREGAFSRHRAAFSADGTVTALNAAPAADGAAAVQLVSSAWLDRAAGVEPLARIAGTATAGVAPASTPLAAAAAVRVLLDQAGIRADEIDRWEVNEAFAVKVLTFVEDLDIDPERVNVNGGAIAYGHPFAASGAIILVHLLAALRADGLRWGVAAIAGAGGVGEAMLVERC